jgi:hypothetical protein
MHWHYRQGAGGLRAEVQRAMVYNSDRGARRTQAARCHALLLSLLRCVHKSIDCLCGSHQLAPISTAIASASLCALNIYFC